MYNIIKFICQGDKTIKLKTNKTIYFAGNIAVKNDANVYSVDLKIQAYVTVHAWVAICSRNNLCRNRMNFR